MEESKAKLKTEDLKKASGGDSVFCCPDCGCKSYMARIRWDGVFCQTCLRCGKELFQGDPGFED